VKRHPALSQLSRDHQHTLAVAQRLRRATSQTAAQAVAAFLAVWELEEKLHFRAEEEVLLPAYAAQGEAAHPVILTVLADHLRIRCAVERLSTDPSLPALHALGALLVSHVRLEEHELFPLIEERVPEAALNALGERLILAAP
jgi:iron-sulfur cluster repair protein YtfE (RIC family)